LLATNISLTLEVSMTYTRITKTKIIPSPITYIMWEYNEGNLMY